MFSCRRYTACSSPFHFWCAIFLFVYDNVCFCVVCACVNLFSYKNWLNFVILLLIARFGWYHLWDVLRVQVLRSFSKFSTDLSKLIIFFHSFHSIILGFSVLNFSELLFLYVLHTLDGFTHCYFCLALIRCHWRYEMTKKICNIPSSCLSARNHFIFRPENFELNWKCPLEYMMLFTQDLYLCSQMRVFFFLFLTFLLNIAFSFVHFLWLARLYLQKSVSSCGLYELL